MSEERYARQTILPQIGEIGQAKLATTSVLIVGVGGLGSPVALYLAGAGIGRIGLVDNDTVSESNLHRQVLYSTDEIGLPKVEMARKRLLELSPDTQVEIHPDGLTTENARRIINYYDIVVDCCDNYATRFLIDDVCAKLRRPWVHGAIGAFVGQVTVFNHRSRKRYSDLYPDREKLSGQGKASAGVLGTVPGVIGAIQANETIKCVLDFGDQLDGKLFQLDLLTLQSNIFKF